MPLRLETLGGLHVLLDGADQPALTRQYLRCGLLVYLALERSAPRERVLSLFWPDRAPEKGRHLLSQMLYELRQGFNRDWVNLEGDRVTVSPEVTADAVDFRHAVAASDPDAERLYRGPFLDSVRLANTPEFESWVERQRNELSGALGEIQRRLVERLTAADDLQGAMAAARRWVLAEPMDEEGQRHLMTLLARSGFRNEALRQFDEYRARLKWLDVQPLEELQALAEDIRSGRLSPHLRSDAIPSTAPQLGARAGVVVLPFEDMSPGQEHAYFCDGLAEEIISSLTTVRGLRVIPRTSAFAFRGSRILDAAAALGVTHAVEGSARVSNDSYRVTVRLIEAAEERELWHDRLRGSLSTDDVFNVQDRIAEAVAHALRDHIAGASTEDVTAARPISSRRPTSSAAAYHLYQKGRQAWYVRTPTGLWDALQLFLEAAEADSNYAQAYAGIADVYCVLGAFDYAALPPSEAYPKAREAAERALDIDPSLGAAHAALGNVLVSFEWDWRAGESQYRQARELDPGYSLARQWHSSLLLFSGHDDEALSEAVLALELDPRSAYVSSHLARLFQLMRRPQQAAEQYRHALEIDPDLVTAHVGLALAELSLGKSDAALGRLQRLDARAGETLTLVRAFWGYALGVTGHKDEARTVCQHLKATPARYLPPEHVGVAYLGLGEADRALDWLERVIDARSQVVTVLEIEPILDPLRNHPKFMKMLEDVRERRLR